MGHTAGVSLGTSLNNRYKTICLDGDGSSLMHLGSLVTLSENVKKNFFYFLLDNQTHRSVGNQSTSSKKILESLVNHLNFKNFMKFK